PPPQSAGPGAARLSRARLSGARGMAGRLSGRGGETVGGERDGSRARVSGAPCYRRATPLGETVRRRTRTRNLSAIGHLLRAGALIKRSSVRTRRLPAAA